VLKAAEPSSIDLQKRYDLVELIDLAQRLNPETRVAWEAARQAAIGVGLVESAYFPVLTLTALGGYQSEAFPAPRPSHPLVLPPKRRHSAGVDLLNCQRRSSGVTVLSLALRH
jgi:outer membrane protein TolC